MLPKSSSQSRIRIGVSQCLLGDNVRYNGEAKKDNFISETLKHFFDFIPVCPEVECGMSIPREPLRLEGTLENTTMITHHSKTDFTKQMNDWGKKKVKELKKLDLHGFIFKARSPSCGTTGIKIYDDKKVVALTSGLFAKIYIETFPEIPVIDEGRLHNIELRENFIERIFIHARWSEFQKKPTMAKLVQFHTEHKMLFLSHSEKHYRKLGALVGNSKKSNLSEVCESYFLIMDEAVRVKTTPAKNANVLQHAMGYFKKFLSSDEKEELSLLIENYRKELIPLIVPITLITHYAKKYNQSYLLNQLYLSPHPLELKLRNHA